MKVCESGRLHPYISILQVSCTACEAGYQDFEGQDSCKTCPGGSTTEDASGRDERGDCILECAAGKYHTGEGVCAVCAAGSYKAAAGTELSCTACEAGYQDEEEQDECKACPGASASLGGDGRDEKSDCVLECAAGRYHDGEGVCGVCWEGSYKAGVNTETNCTACGENTYQDEEEQAKP